MEFTTGNNVGEVYYLTGSNATFSILNILSRELAGGDLSVTEQRAINVGGTFSITVAGLLSGVNNTYNTVLAEGLPLNGFITVVIMRQDGTKVFLPIGQIRQVQGGDYLIDLIQPGREFIPIPEGAQFQ